MKKLGIVLAALIVTAVLERLDKDKGMEISKGKKEKAHARK